MRSSTFFAFALPALVSAQPKLVQRAVGDIVTATIDGQVVTWVNEYAGPGAPAPAATPNAGSGGGGGGGQAATPASSPPVSTPTTSSTPVYQPPPTTSSTGGALTTTTTPSPSSTTPSSTSSPPASTSSSSSSSSSGPSGGSCPEGQQSIEIQNTSGKDLIIQAAAPWTEGSCGTISSGSTCTICQLRGSTGGNLQVGYGVANGRATWIEGNWDTDAQFPCMDISYIPGYSVPILCTGSDGSSTIGMSEPLCADEACSNCETGGGTYQDGACLNPMGVPETVLVDGPAPAFFSSATGIVYTYPNDSHDGYAPVWDSAKCVVGPQFGSGSSKREVKKEEKRVPHSHSHLGKRHSRHAHRHAVHAGSNL